MEGPRGTQGLRGPQSLQGPQGIQGPQGDAGTFSFAHTDLDMDDHKITRLSTDAADVMSAADVRFVNNAKADLILKLSESFQQKINESHVSSSND